MRTRLIACVVAFVAIVASDVSAQVTITPRPGVTGTGVVTSGVLRTGTTSGDTLLIQAYDVDGAAWTTLIEGKAGNTPTLTALFGSGSGASPSFGFVEDPDTGIFRVGANNIGFTTNGAIKAYISADYFQLYNLSMLWNSDGVGGIGNATANRPSHLHLNRGTLTDPAYAISTVGVWNDAADTFTLWFANVTDTASAAGSLLVDLQVGSASKFKVAKDGGVTAGAGITAGGNLGAAAASAIYWVNRSVLVSGSDGAVTLAKNAQTGFSDFNLGPQTGNTATGVSAIKHVETVIDMATATGTGTGTITSPTTALPVGLVKGVACRVTTVLAGAGLTTFSIGDGTDVDRWGVGIAIAAGTTTSIADYTVSSPAYQTAAGSIVLTAAAGVFSTGVLKCTTYVETQTPIGT